MPADPPSPALARARSAAEAARRGRAELVSAISSGRLPLSRVGDEAHAARVKAVVIAEAVPGVGKVRARRVVDALGVAPSALWGELTDVQRDALVDELKGGGGRPAGAP